MLKSQANQPTPPATQLPAIVPPRSSPSPSKPPFHSRVAPYVVYSAPFTRIQSTPTNSSPGDRHINCRDATVADAGTTNRQRRQAGAPSSRYLLCSTSAILPARRPSRRPVRIRARHLLSGSRCLVVARPGFHTRSYSYSDLYGEVRDSTRRICLLETANRNRHIKQLPVWLSPSYQSSGIKMSSPA